jgi:hypothetical protein
MSNKLADFLIKMADDLDLQQSYATEPEAVMTQYGLTGDDKAALRTGNEGSIFARIDSPGDVIIVKLILAFKKKKKR